MALSMLGVREYTVRFQEYILGRFRETYEPGARSTNREFRWLLNYHAAERYLLSIQQVDPSGGQ
jgi:hypothetical protein